MTLLTGITPTPAQLADAWAAAFGDALRVAAGADGRLSAATARRLALSVGPEFLAADNVLNFLEATGQQTVSAEKFIRVARDYVERQASAVAGSNQRLSLAEAEGLPADLRDDFLYLRGKGAPEHVSAQDLEAIARGVVLAAFADWQRQPLAAPPWQVLGERELLAVIHPQDVHTQAHVYVARGKVWVSIGRTASASSETPGVGWYDLGWLPDQSS